EGASGSAIGPPLPGQGGQSKAVIESHPALCGSVRNARLAGHGGEGSTVFEVGLERAVGRRGTIGTFTANAAAPDMIFCGLSQDFTPPAGKQEWSIASSGPGR